MHSKMESVSKQDPANQQSGLEQKSEDDNLKNRRIFTHRGSEKFKFEFQSSGFKVAMSQDLLTNSFKFT